MTAQSSKPSLLTHVLRLADSSLVLGHRLSEWSGKGPQLEEVLALANIGLDLIGRCRSLYDYAAQLEGKSRTQDDLAFRRDVSEFRNHLLVEQPNGDYAQTLVRQLLYDGFSWLQYRGLSSSTDANLAGIAEKSLKEIRYHYRHSRDWVVRFGDGTEESHRRAQAAIDGLWRFVPDLFDLTSEEQQLVADGVILDPASFHEEWMGMMQEVFTEGTLVMPTTSFAVRGSGKGVHTEHLGFLLAEMQFLQRAYPDARWD